jgi:hypothetical protein
VSAVGAESNSRALTPITNQGDTFVLEINTAIPMFGVKDWAFEILDSVDIDSGVTIAS